MRRTTAVLGLCAVALLLTGCGKGVEASDKLTRLESSCAAITGAAGGVPLVNAATPGPRAVQQARQAASTLQQAATTVHSTLAEPARRLSRAVRSYADALTAHDTEQITIDKAALLRTAQPVADACGIPVTKIFGSQG